MMLRGNNIGWHLAVYMKRAPGLSLMFCFLLEIYYFLLHLQQEPTRACDSGRSFQVLNIQECEPSVCQALTVTLWQGSV